MMQQQRYAIEQEQDLEQEQELELKQEPADEREYMQYLKEKLAYLHINKAPEARQQPFIHQHLVQEQVKKQVVPQQKQALAVAAFLNPAEFDNYRLWSLLYKRFTPLEIKYLSDVARKAKFDQLSPLKYYFWPEISIFYPELGGFMQLLADNRVDMARIAAVFKDCLTVTEVPKPLLYWLNRKENVNNKGPKDPKGPDNGDNNPPIPPNDGNNAGAFMGNPNFNFHPKNVSYNIYMQVLAGFIAVLGIAAVVVAFAALNAATCGVAGVIVATVGFAALVGGVGLFKHSYDAEKKQLQAVQANNWLNPGV